MIYKPPHDEETALAWHQDYTFWDHVGPADLGTCWIALDDATVDNGCMHVIPGSHLWPMRYDREDAVVDDPHWLLRQEGIPAGADLTPVPCEVPAGHCHFHHCKTFHGSYGNSTGNPRRSYIMHLMPGHTRRLGNNWNERMGNVETVKRGGGAAGGGVSGARLPARVRRSTLHSCMPNLHDISAQRTIALTGCFMGGLILIRSPLVKQPGSPSPMLFGSTPSVESSSLLPFI